MDAKALAESNTGIGEFVFLDNSRYDLKDEKVTLLGGTLFNLPHKGLRQSIVDYYTRYMRIGGWGAEQHFQAHKDTCKWLLHESSDIEKEDSQRAIIILSHYCPTRNWAALGTSVMYRFTTDRKWLHRFMTQNVKLWAFGSTHYNCDFIDFDNGKRFYSNQKGFPGEINDFQVTKVVDIGPIEQIIPGFHRGGH
ncbi:hypothetical protein F5Y06DRAFT_226142 [Hypoxylon sp. FL0890]|nr:hypothetical protein F5Y06DRAFT_226142 [Hypoxylon sp. FL0890]